MLQIFHHPATESSVEVFARWQRGRPPADDQVQLSIRGPYSELGRTLPATFPMRLASPGVWWTTVVDPCVWSPDSPARYRLHGKGASWSTAIGPSEFAIRGWVAQGGHLWLRGRRWVLRAAAANCVAGRNLDACRDSLLSWVVEPGDTELAAACALQGVPLAARISSAEWPAACRTVSAWPACLMAILPATLSAARDEIKQLTPNLILAAELDLGDPMSVPAWADAILSPALPDRLAEIQQVYPSKVLMAAAQVGALQGPAAARCACELLQQRLAPEFNLSGYLVS